MSLEMPDLEKALRLSHLEISEADKLLYLGQLHSIIEYMKVLEAMDLDKVEPSAYAHDQQQYLREDVVEDQGDLLLEKNAPDWQDGSFSVPKILG
ncbi:Asp-tRNA(Asn)/Glu-tRNA(Gln) amidotransferase GatCAB subunit C [Candidatus Marinamargulisbacteria bacterium SCGC AAA071-K20]|nr:Asp-tRNA(Asn)/Glu-tRNA(Gln) amidotransferase GatCAB subunit C [Candidatus Marinamargulisbacteria bacterium SCGC AAA071-K20]